MGSDKQHGGEITEMTQSRTCHLREELHVALDVERRARYVELDRNELEALHAE